MLKHARDTALVALITLLLIEFVGLFVKRDDYFWEFRNLFASKNAFRPIGKDGLWTYRPNSKIVAAAVYHLSKFTGWIEYRCVVETNKFGLVATNFGDRSDIVDYLVLGDSFTEGQGGCPWLTKNTLNETDPTIINAGLQGSGIQHFEMVLDWLAAQVKIKNLTVVAISNDFKRGPTPGIWRGREPCLEEGICDPQLDFWWAVDADISNHDLLKKSKERFAARGLSIAQQGGRHSALLFSVVLSGSEDLQTDKVFRRKGRPRKAGCAVEAQL